MRVKGLTFRKGGQSGEKSVDLQQRSTFPIYRCPAVCEI